MPLRVIQGPAPNVVILPGRLPSILIELVREDDIEIAGRPLPIYATTLIAFLKDTVLDEAELAGWQYFLTRGNEAIAAIEVAKRHDGFAYSGVFAGAHIESSMEAISIAEALPVVRDHNYELRILRAPLAFLHAVWLRSPDNDLLIPIYPVPSPLQPNTVYTEWHVSNALRPFAVQRVTVSDEEEPEV